MEMKQYWLIIEIENVKLTVELSNGFFASKKTSCGLHSHHSFEVHSILFGTVELISENDKYTMNKNDTFILAPGALHYLSFTEPDAITSSFSFSFSKSKKKSDTDLYSIFERSFSSFGNVAKVNDAFNNSFFLNKILSLFYSENPINAFEVKMYFAIMITEMAKSFIPSQIDYHSNSEVIPESDVRHYVAEEFIQNNYHKNITISDLAKELFLSEQQTARVFKTEFKKTFKKYLTQIRLSNAKSYLVKTDMSVCKIAELVGYSTYNGFYNMFLENTGITPLEYRAKAKNKRA